MRSDVTLYVVAAFFFVLTVTSAVIFNDAERSLWIVSTAVLGTLSAGLGYYQRPKPKSIQKLQAATVASISSVEPATVPVQETHIEQATIIQSAHAEETPVNQTPVKETAQIVQTPAPVAPQEQAPIETSPQKTEATPDELHTVSALTTVKGIGEKRAAQLYSLGINTVEELAKASVDDLASKLKVSPKIVAKWVEAAKQQ
jgi:predicted flap endonuclease-1-like 5' DNA nuclease